MFFAPYNLAWLLRPHPTQEQQAKDTLTAFQAGTFYGGFAVAAALLAAAISAFGGLGYTVAIVLFTLYLIGYFALWWPIWHSTMYAIDPLSRYRPGTEPGNATEIGRGFS